MRPPWNSLIGWVAGSAQEDRTRQYQEDVRRAEIAQENRHRYSRTVSGVSIRRTPSGHREFTFSYFPPPPAPPSPTSSSSSDTVTATHPHAKFPVGPHTISQAPSHASYAAYSDASSTTPPVPSLVSDVTTTAVSPISPSSNSKPVPIRRHKPPSPSVLGNCTVPLLLQWDSPPLPPVVTNEKGVPTNEVMCRFLDAHEPAVAHASPKNHDSDPASQPRVDFSDGQSNIPPQRATFSGDQSTALPPRITFSDDVSNTARPRVSIYGDKSNRIKPRAAISNDNSNNPSPQVASSDGQSNTLPPRVTCSDNKSNAPPPQATLSDNQSDNPNPSSLEHLQQYFGPLSLDQLKEKIRQEIAGPFNFYGSRQLSIDMNPLVQEFNQRREEAIKAGEAVPSPLAPEDIEWSVSRRVKAKLCTKPRVFIDDNGCEVHQGFGLDFPPTATNAEPYSYANTYATWHNITPQRIAVQPVNLVELPPKVATPTVAEVSCKPHAVEVNNNPVTSLPVRPEAKSMLKRQQANIDLPHLRSLAEKRRPRPKGYHVRIVAPEDADEAIASDDEDATPVLAQLPTFSAANRPPPLKGILKKPSIFREDTPSPSDSLLCTKPEPNFVPSAPPKRGGFFRHFMAMRTKAAGTHLQIETPLDAWTAPRRSSRYRFGIPKRST